ncbi:MAG: redox-sensing transcriptional repressor Rex [Planctomycetota bacterium]|jgi:redox-sensing transcriptional repressor
MRYRKIPDEAVKRMPMYLRGLLLCSEQGLKSVSSDKLAKMLHVNSPQIRKDLSYFGAFGTPGVGYDTQKLAKQIRDILKLKKTNKAALIGIGNLGSALLKSPGFAGYGLEIAAVFDNAPGKIGKNVNDFKIEDISKLSTLKRKGITLGIIAVPARAAQDVADRLVKAGVKGILNFAPYYVDVPKKVKVISIDIAMDLARLPYYMSANRKSG